MLTQFQSEKFGMVKKKKNHEEMSKKVLGGYKEYYTHTPCIIISK